MELPTLHGYLQPPYNHASIFLIICLDRLLLLNNLHVFLLTRCPMVSPKLSYLIFILISVLEFILHVQWIFLGWFKNIIFFTKPTLPLVVDISGLNVYPSIGTLEAGFNSAGSDYSSSTAGAC